MQETILPEAFFAADIRVGTVIEASPFEQATRPAYILRIDFGEAIGVLKSSAQITSLYTPEELTGQQVIAVVNFPPKQIANLMSQCLVLGAKAPDGSVVLLKPDRRVNDGLRIS